MFEVLLSCLTPSAKTGEKSQPASTMILIKNPTDVLRNRRHLFQNAGHTQVNKWEYPNTFTVCAWIWMAEPTVIETHYPLVWTVLYHSQRFNCWILCNWVHSAGIRRNGKATPISGVLKRSRNTLTGHFLSTHLLINANYPTIWQQLNAFWQLGMIVGATWAGANFWSAEICPHRHFWVYKEWKKKKRKWEAVLCVKMPHWCQMSEDNGQTVSSWYEGNSNLNIQLLKFKMCKQLKILCSFSVLSSG